MTDKTVQMNEDELQDLVASSDTGGRNPRGFPAKLIVIIAIAWSLFQLYFSSPLPFIFQSWLNAQGIDISVALDDTKARSIHLAFALALVFLTYPAFKHSPRRFIPVPDWVLAFVGAFLGAYYFIFYLSLVERVGTPNTMDLIAGVCGILVLLEATRRSLGAPLAIIAICFLLFNFAGPHLPQLIAHNANKLTTVINQQWITTEGVFGIALGVSTKFVFLFVLFGALLDKAGAGNYFIQTAFSLLGHFCGGPAKAAVVASGATGLISGSSIANVVTTGTFTIPMMKKVGFSSEKAGAVEVASSVNGQIMPPVMGAAAFLMVEYVGISYFEVIQHAVIPAIISYFALFYIVHLEAMKVDMKALPFAGVLDPTNVRVMRFVVGILGLFAFPFTLYQLSVVLAPILGSFTWVGFALLMLAVIFTLNKTRKNKVLCFSLKYFTFFVALFAIFFFINWIKLTFPSLSLLIIGAFLVSAYVLLVKRSAQYPELKMDDPNSPVVKLPEVEPTVNSGLHFILPVAVLVWALMIQRLSPGSSAFFGTMFLIFIILTQKPLFAFFRGQTNPTAKFKDGFKDLLDGLETGARNMIGIAIATATAGIIVGVVALTNIGAPLAAIVEIVSGGNILLMLLMIGVLSLILGMGLPTTANYIVVSSLLATVVVEVGRQNGLVVPLIAVHLFVFYFGIMADVTPPVGLASFAAAAVSGGAPIKTGFIAFFYSLRTAILPFLFIFNTDLLLIDVTWAEGIMVFVVATLAILVFTAASQGFFFDKCNPVEIVLLLLIAFTLFRPGFFMDMISPSATKIPPVTMVASVGKAPAGKEMMFEVNGLNDIGDPVTFFVPLPIEGSTGEERLTNAGLTLRNDGDKVFIDDVAFDSPAQQAGLDWDQEILSVKLPNADALPKQLLFIPALILLVMIALWQRKRRANRIEPQLTTA